MSPINNNGQVGRVSGPGASSEVSAKANAGLDKLGAIVAGNQPSTSSHVVDAANLFAKLK